MQQAVVEFILNHTEQIFNHGTGLCKAKEGMPPWTHTHRVSHGPKVLRRPSKWPAYQYWQSNRIEEDDLTPPYFLMTFIFKNPCEALWIKHLLNYKI